MHVITIFVVVLFGSSNAASWIGCSSENQWCSFSGTTEVRYGTGERWCVKNFTGGVLCTGAGTGCGDPVHDSVKSCEINPTPTSPWVMCASETGICNVGVSGEVRYGGNNQYVFKSLPATGIQCSSAAFGTDPANGYVKNCYYRANPPKWVIEVQEFQTANVSSEAKGLVIVGSVGVLNCGNSNDITYSNTLEFQEQETHTWGVTTTHSGSVSITVATDVQGPVVSASVSLTAEYSFSKTESKDKQIATTITRTHGITASIPKMTKTVISMQGTNYIATIPWTGIMYQVDDQSVPIANTTMTATGTLQSARTSQYYVILRESAPTAGAC